jgi:hypothetical protein
VTVSGIAGLYYGTSGVLALATTNAFSELSLLPISSSVLQPIDGFLGELGKLAAIRKANPMIVAAALEENVFLNWLKTIEDRRESKSEIHLITDLPGRAPQGSPAVRDWLTEPPHFKVHYAPIVRDLFWFNLVQRCFRIIGGLPMQVSLVKGIKGIAQYLASMPDQSRVGIISVWRSLPQQPTLYG